MNILQIGVMIMILITIGLIIFTMIQAYEPYVGDTIKEPYVKECIERPLAMTKICP